MDFIAFLETVAEKHFLDTNLGQEKIHIRKWWPFGWYVDFKVDSSGVVMPAGVRLFLEHEKHSQGKGHFKETGQVLDVSKDKILNHVLVFRLAGKSDAVRVLAFRVHQSNFHSNGIVKEPNFTPSLENMLEQQTENTVHDFVKVLSGLVAASRTLQRQGSTTSIVLTDKISAEDLDNLIQLFSLENNMVDALSVKAILQIVGLGAMPEHVDQALEEMLTSKSSNKSLGEKDPSIHDAAPATEQSKLAKKTLRRNSKNSSIIRTIPNSIKASEIAPYVRAFEVDGFLLSFQIPMDYLVQLHTAFEKLDKAGLNKVLLSDYLQLLNQLQWDWLAQQIENYIAQALEDPECNKEKSVKGKLSNPKSTIMGTLSPSQVEHNAKPSFSDSPEALKRTRLSRNSMKDLKSKLGEKQLAKKLSTLGKSLAIVHDDEVEEVSADYDNTLSMLNIDEREEITFSQLASFVALCYASENKMDAMREIFMMIDLNGDGTIARDELDVILRGVKVPSHHRNRILLELFIGEDNYVGWEAFHEVMIKEEKNGRVSTEVLLNIKTAFDNLDSDGSGTVSPDEVAKMLKKMGLDFTNEELQDWLKKLDEDGDGEITFYEFLKALSYNSESKYRNKITELFSATNLAAVDAYVLSSSLEEIEKVMDINNMAILPRMAAKLLRAMHANKLAESPDKQRPRSASNPNVSPARREGSDFLGIEAKVSKRMLKASSKPARGAHEELIGNDQKDKLRYFSNLVVFRAFLAGVVSAVCAFVGEFYADERFRDVFYVDDQQEPLMDSNFYWHLFLKYGVAILATGLEIMYLYYDMLCICIKMTEVVGITLYPLNPERAFLVQACTNVSLELGHSNQERYKINPVRELSKAEQLFAAVAYKAKGGVTNFIGKTLAKRALARMGARAIGPAIGIPIVSILNVIVAIWVSRSLIVVCIGSIYNVAICDALLAAHRHLSVEVKHALIQAVSVAVVKQTQWHPNSELCFKYLLRRLNLDAASVQNLGDANKFLNETLPNLKLTEQYLTLRVLSLAMILDGRLSPGRKRYLKKCLETCCFWADLRALTRLKNKFNDMSLTAADFLNLYASYHKRAGLETDSAVQWIEQMDNLQANVGEMLIF